MPFCAIRMDDGKTIPGIEFRGDIICEYARSSDRSEIVGLILHQLKTPVEPRTEPKDRTTIGAPFALVFPDRRSMWTVANWFAIAYEKRINGGFHDPSGPPDLSGVKTCPPHSPGRFQGHIRCGACGSEMNL